MNRDRIAILNAHTIAEAAALLSLSPAYVRVLRHRLLKAGKLTERKKCGRPATPRPQQAG